MVAADYPSAVRAGTMAAARLHQQLGLRQLDRSEAGGNVDVFAAIHALDLPCSCGLCKDSSVLI